VAVSHVATVSANNLVYPASSRSVNTNAIVRDGGIKTCLFLGSDFSFDFNSFIKLLLIVPGQNVFYVT